MVPSLAALVVSVTCVITCVFGLTLAASIGVLDIVTLIKSRASARVILITIITSAIHISITSSTATEVFVLILVVIVIRTVVSPVIITTAIGCAVTRSVIKIEIARQRPWAHTLIVSGGVITRWVSTINVVVRATSTAAIASIVSWVSTVVPSLISATWVCWASASALYPRRAAFPATIASPVVRRTSLTRRTSSVIVPASARIAITRAWAAVSSRVATIIWRTVSIVVVVSIIVISIIRVGTASHVWRSIPVARRRSISTIRVIRTSSIRFVRTTIIVAIVIA
mmetsp:Transcript_20704/g.40658  ORF Transcript_20704/g.40658 Transcript_20704/m.40658 type:complete len:284 (-) Transcript_20704:2458-3309(-)